jgi:hypothetical protein
MKSIMGGIYKLTLPTAASPRRTSFTLLLGRAAEVVEGSAILLEEETME